MSTWIETRETRHFASELKFLVDATIADAIRSWARSRIPADPHGSGAAGDEYVTTSVYFDTPSFDVALRNGSFGRSKYRIRRYGQSDIVFLERKLRTSRFLTKRRSIVSLDDLNLLDDDATNDWAGRWFQRRLFARALRPAVQVSYLRTARVAMTSVGPARLTIDSNILARPVADIDFNGTSKTKVFDDQAVVEIKYRVAPPPVFKELATEFNLNPQPLSKYRFAARKLGLVTVPARLAGASSEAS